MPPPTQLAIKTGVLSRLLKDLESYEVERQQQEAHIEKLRAGNADEYELRQQLHVLQDTEKMVPSLKPKLKKAAVDLEMVMLDADELHNPGNTDETRQKAIDALRKSSQYIT